MPPPLPTNVIETATQIRWDGVSPTCLVHTPGQTRYSAISIKRLSKSYPYFERLLRLAHNRDPWGLHTWFTKWLPTAKSTEHYLVVIGKMYSWDQWIGLSVQRPTKRKEKGNLPLFSFSHADNSHAQGSMRDFENNFPGSTPLVMKCVPMYEHDSYTLAVLLKALLVAPLSALPLEGPGNKNVSAALHFARDLGLDAEHTVLYMRALLESKHDVLVALPLSL
jgi:hypothetical protein